VFEVVGGAELFAHLLHSLRLVESALPDGRVAQIQRDVREFGLVPSSLQLLVCLTERGLAVLPVAGPRTHVPDARRGDHVLPLLAELARVVPVLADRLARTVELAKASPHMGMKVERKLPHSRYVTEPVDDLVGVPHSLLDPARSPDEVRSAHADKADL